MVLTRLVIVSAVSLRKNALAEGHPNDAQQGFLQAPGFPDCKTCKTLAPHNIPAVEHQNVLQVVMGIVGKMKI